jgi:hypothetical protein
LRLISEKLEHHHSANVLLQIGIYTRDGNANSPIGIAHPIAENLCGINNERKHGKCDQRQFPVHAQHDTQNAEEHEKVFED